jgi:hypothetical protein
LDGTLAEYQMLIEQLEAQQPEETEEN